MPKYELRDVPRDLWDRFTSRAKSEGWLTRDLFLQMMRDYVSGRNQPGPPPIQRPEFAWLRVPFRDLMNRPDFLTSRTANRWYLLERHVREHVPDRAPQLEAVPVEDRPGLIEWLSDTALVDLRSTANPLTLRAIGHIGHGPDLQAGRRVFQYEVQGLPSGQQALITDFNGWRIQRFFADRPPERAGGERAFPSAAAARDYLESVLEAEQRAPHTS